MKRILLVDDELDLLQTLRILLTGEGYKVATACSGQEALATLNHEPVDLVITDFNMSVMKGDELAALIRQRWPEMPVLMLTGSGELLRSSGRELPGVAALMGKPFKLTELLETIARLLKQTGLDASPAGDGIWPDQRQRDPAESRVFTPANPP